MPPRRRVADVGMSRVGYGCVSFPLIYQLAFDDDILEAVGRRAGRSIDAPQSAIQIRAV